jgi:hypothetical protein
VLLGHTTLNNPDAGRLICYLHAALDVVAKAPG